MAICERLLVDLAIDSSGRPSPPPAAGFVNATTTSVRGGEMGWDLGLGTWGLGLGAWGLGLGTWDLGLGAWGDGEMHGEMHGEMGIERAAEGSCSL